MCVYLSWWLGCTVYVYFSSSVVSQFNMCDSRGGLNSLNQTIKRWIMLMFIIKPQVLGWVWVWCKQMKSVVSEHSADRLSMNSFNEVLPSYADHISPKIHSLLTNSRIIILFSFKSVFLLLCLLASLLPIYPYITSLFVSSPSCACHLLLSSSFLSPCFFYYVFLPLGVIISSTFFFSFLSFLLSSIYLFPYFFHTLFSFFLL